jgi:hypothetical protein
MRASLRCLGSGLLLLLGPACAAGPPGEVSPTAQTTTMVMVDTHGEPSAVTTAVPVANAVRVPLSVDSALAALARGYAAVQVEVTLVDPAQHRLGNPRFTARHTLAGESMTHFVNCGQTMTTSHAERDQILFSVVSTVRPLAGGGSLVETLVTASAQDRTAGTVGDMLPCTTSGSLEAKIHHAAFGV